MKKFLYGCCLLISLCSPLAYAGGSLTHMFIAEESIAKLTDPNLRNAILNNMDAYLSGAYYPDTGYVKGTSYGEDSHWDPFIFAFADYIKAKYTDPLNQNPKLVAFLFGCAVHRMSDEIIHRVFYDDVETHDFPGNHSKAHSYGDTGIDLLIAIDKSGELVYPQTPWFPVSDLLAVYHNMGKDDYTAAQILWGTSVLSTAIVGEKWIAPIAHPFLKWEMPWTAANYYTCPDGGVLTDEDQTAQYEMTVWNRITGSSAKIAALKPYHLNYQDSSSTFLAMAFAQTALEAGIMSVSTQTNDDGSISLGNPVINDIDGLQTLLRKLIADLMNL